MVVRLQEIPKAAQLTDVGPAFMVDIPELIPVVRAFESNVDLFRLFASLPTSLIGLGSKLQHAWCEAKHAATGDWDFKRDDSQRADIAAEMPVIVDKSHWLDYDLLFEFENVTSGVSLQSEMTVEGHSFVEEGMSVFLSAQIILSWTIFESVAKDLWISAVDMKTDTLGRSIAFKAAPNDTQSGKSIKLSILAEADWTLKGKLGTLYNDKFDFGSPEKAKAAYEAAFGEQTALSQVFDDKSLCVVNLVRNLLIHKNGIGDEKFMKGIADSGLFGSTKRGDRIELSPTEASIMSSAVLRASTSLIKFVQDAVR